MQVSKKRKSKKKAKMVVIHRIIIRCRTIFDPSLRKLASQPKAFFALVLFKTNKKTKKNDLSLQKKAPKGRYEV